MMACTFSDAFTRSDDHRVDPLLGGGCLLDLGCIVVYSTLWLTGLYPLALSAYGTKVNGVWSSLQILANLNNGAVAHWDCGFDCSTRRWIEVGGTEGSWVCDDFLRPWNLDKPRFWLHKNGGGSETVTSA